MEVSDIHAAVIVGGSSLIPKIQDQLKEKLKLDELTRNLDAFESAALGAGFYAAGLSPSFRVREVGVTDLYPFGVKATVSKSRAEDAEAGSEGSRSEVVFEPKEPVPNRKYLLFTRDTNFTVDLEYTNPEVMSADTEVDIGRYNLTGVNKCEKYNTTDKPQMTLKLEIDRNGMATLSEANAGVTEWTEKQVKIPRKKKKKTEEEDKPKKSDEDDKDKDEGDEKDSAEEEEGGSESAEAEEVVEEVVHVEEDKCAWNATVNVTLGDADAEGQEPKEVGPYVSMNDGENKTMAAECERVNPEFEGEIVLHCAKTELTADTSDCLPVVYETRSEKVARSVALRSKYAESGISKMTKSKKEGASAKLQKIQKVMDEIHRLAKAKNDVEAHIFETRDMMEYNDELKVVMSEEQNEEMRAVLSAAEEWMWEDYTYSEYVDKLYELRDAIKPALIRKDEAISRPEALAAAHEALTGIQAKLSNESFMENMPANETETMVEKTASFELYLKEKEEAQAALELTEEPAFMTAELSSKMRSYEKAMAAAMAKKPKPKKKKKPKKPKAAEVSCATQEEQLEILTEFYAEIEEEKTAEELVAILDKRKDEDAEVLSSEQFRELCDKLKAKKSVDPLELWAERHPPEEPEGAEGAEGDEDSGGGWFSGWGSGGDDKEEEATEEEGQAEGQAEGEEGESEADADGGEAEAEGGEEGGAKDDL